MLENQFITEVIDRLARIETKQERMLDKQEETNGNILENRRRIEWLEKTDSKTKINWLHISIAIFIGGIIVAAGLNLTEFIGRLF